MISLLSLDVCGGSEQDVSRPQVYRVPVVVKASVVTHLIGAAWWPSIELPWIAVFTVDTPMFLPPIDAVFHGACWRHGSRFFGGDSHGASVQGFVIDCGRPVDRDANHDHVGCCLNIYGHNRDESGRVGVPHFGDSGCSGDYDDFVRSAVGVMVPVVESFST